MKIAKHHQELIQSKFPTNNFMMVLDIWK